MKKMLLTLAATALCASAYAAEVGDTTQILSQTFGAGTVLANTSEYIWGDDIQGMIIVPEEDGDQNRVGLYLTNGSNAENNYTNREFLKFKNALGDATNAFNVSYEVYNPKDKGQANTEYEINYFNERNKFVFGIQETSGGWAYGANIITANEDGSTTISALPAGHMSKGGGSVVDLTVKFVGETAIIEIDGGSYSAYTKSQGIKSIKLSVGGGNGFDRDMYIRNFDVNTIKVEAVQTAGYTLKYVVGEEVIKEIAKVGVVGEAIAINPDETRDFFNEDNTVKYLYVSNDAEGKTIDAEGTTVVTLVYRIAGDYNYSVKNNVNDAAIEGTCIEGEAVTVPYHRYILGADGMVWLKDATDKQYNFSFTPDQDNYVANLEYAETDMTDGLYFVEGEDIEGMTATSANNANVRCSNAAAGYVPSTEENPTGKIDICKLSAGTYKVAIAGWGGAGTDLIVKAGEETVLTVTTTGSWAPGTSEEFTLTEETILTFEGATSSRPLDYILITGNGTIGDTSAVSAINAANADGKWYNLQGVQVAAPTQSGLYIRNGKKVIVK